MPREDYEIGLIGLGTMGRNLLLNMSDHGFAVAGYNRTRSKLDALISEAGDREIRGAESIEELIGLLHRPRVIMIMVAAGKPVDSVIQQLSSKIEKDDIIIDGGNSHFLDTNRRFNELSRKGVNYIGMGVSGGESGARYGPSLMPGGTLSAYERIRPVYESIAAHVNGDPCITYLGTGSAGHYVKMVHNGIEYAIMQLLAESYDLMKEGFSLTNDDLHEVFSQWNSQELNSYLVEITAAIFEQIDPLTGGYLIDYILDTAKQKGTGKWTSQDALELGVPTPSIDVAVTMRYMSARKDERLVASEIMKERRNDFKGELKQAIDELRNAVYISMIISYAQGLDLLRAASDEYDYELDLEGTVKIWRGGCIIRAAMLENFRSAFQERPDLSNLLLDPGIAKIIGECEDDLRTTIQRSAGLGITTPGLMASYNYLKSYSQKRLPANLIQAQRDYFGAHRYQRIDSDETFHTNWEDTKD